LKGEEWPSPPVGKCPEYDELRKSIKEAETELENILADYKVQLKCDNLRYFITDNNYVI
jgi:hypothetical protein